MADFNKPDNSTEIVSNHTEIRNNINAVAKQFKGVAASNIPVDAVKYENGIHYRYSGTLWNPEVESVLGGGTGASTALGARQNLGCNDAANLTTGTLPSGRLTGTYNIDVSGNSASSSNASLLESQNGAFYRNASNLNAGTVPIARLSGTYNIGISGLAANSLLLQGNNAAYFRNASNLNAGVIPVAQLSGTYNIGISGTSANASLLESQNGAFYRNASNLNAGTVPEIRLTSGTTSVKGILQLTDSISSTSITTAATPNSVKSAYDLASINKGLRTVFITSGSGNWIVPAGVTAFKVTVVGGGGAGGAAAGAFVAGSGGNHGAVAIKWYSGVTPSASYAYSVGAGGVSAGSHTQISNSGGTTTFDSLSAGGGGGGYGSAVAGAPQTVLSGGSSGGDINTRSHLHQQIHGSSGNYGQGGANPSPSNGVGGVGQGYGAGGGGAYDTDNNGDLGGAGSSGAIIIEY